MELNTYMITNIYITTYSMYPSTNVPYFWSQTYHYDPMTQCTSDPTMATYMMRSQILNI